MSDISPAAPTANEYRDMLRRLRVLIVGGGAIGQVYGTHLQAGGAEVSFFLKHKYAAEAEQGWDLHQYGLSGVRPRKHLKPAAIFTDHRYLRTKAFDQIWLCVSSPALRGSLVEQLASSCPDAVWVSFQPGLEDRELLLRHVPAGKLIVGLVNYIAYQAPLPGEELWPAGIAYFVPPFTMTQLSGPEPYVSAVANLLQTGGLKAGVRPDTVEVARYGSSVLIPFIIALECSSWSWSQLRSNKALVDLMVQSITDIQTAIEKATRAIPGSFGMAQKSFAWKLALFAAPKLASFPLEDYFKFHFTKVREQSDQMVDDFAQMCRDNAIIPRALETLREQWRGRRSPTPYEATRLEEQTDPDGLPAPLPSFTAPNPPVSATGASAAVDSSAIRPGGKDVGAVEPTRPMSMDGPTTKPAALAIPVDEQPSRSPGAAVAPIEVDFDFDGSTPNGAEAAPVDISPESLEELTDAPVDLEDDEIFVSQGAASHRRELPELNVELAPEPLEPAAQPESDAPKPVLRTLADLDHIPAIGDEPPSQQPAPSPPKPSKPLPFAVKDEAPLPSVVVDADLETEEHPRGDMRTIRNPEPVPVHFRDALPEDEQQNIRRQDFIQTEFASEEQNADLRNLKNQLRARLDAKRSLSPALDDDD